MFEQYGFECDCEACTLTGTHRRENNQQRRLVQDLDVLIERLLYEFPPGDENSSEPVMASPEVDISPVWLEKVDSAHGDPDMADILTAIKLNYYKLTLMDKLGFKVVSQVGQALIGMFYFLISLLSRYLCVRTSLKSAKSGSWKKPEILRLNQVSSWPNVSTETNLSTTKPG